MKYKMTGIKPPSPKRFGGLDSAHFVDIASTRDEKTMVKLR